MRYFLRALSVVFVFIAGMGAGTFLSISGINTRDVLMSEWFLLLPNPVYMIWAVGALALGIFLRYVAGRLEEKPDEFKGKRLIQV